MLDGTFKAPHVHTTKSGLQHVGRDKITLDGQLEAFEFGIAIGDGSVPASTLVNELVAFNKGQSSLGTFVREQKMKLTNTIINVSVGMNF